MFQETAPPRQRLPMLRLPSWWVGVGALVGLVATTQSLSFSALTYGGLAASLAFVAAAEIVRRRCRNAADAVVESQVLSGVAIVALGVVTGPLSVQLRAGVLTMASPSVWLVWAACAALLLTAGLQIFTSTRRLIVGGRLDTERLLASERDAQEAELLVQQQRLEPELVLRAMSVIADQAERSPRQAEQSVEHLAAFLRKSLTTTPSLTAPLDEEVARAKEYGAILSAGGVDIPITWSIDDDVREVALPGGTLRTFLDYAVSRCLRTPGSGISIRAYQHAKRLYLIVKDNAAPDPPMLAEPEGLANLRRRLGAPPQRRVRVETSVMFEVDGVDSGTTQTLSIRLPEAA